MAYAVFDIETSIYESFGRKANPFDSRNYIVSVGIKYQNGKSVKTHLSDGNVLPKGDWLAGVDCIVGINLKFDLLYLWDNPVVKAFFKRGGRIYDCQYAEYLVTAQQSKWASMDGMSAKYGGTQKIDKIKEYWKDGVQTIEIPKHELLEYLQYDLDNTEIIFKAIVKKAKQQDMVNTIRAHMDGLCATIEMEYNGLKIDWDAARKNQKVLEDKLVEINNQLNTFIPKDLPEGLEFNFGSGEHLSALLFGGSLKYKVREPVVDELGIPQYAMKTTKVPAKDPHGNVVTYKTGKKAGEVKYRNVKSIDYTRPKTKLVEREHRIKGMSRPRKEWALAKDGVYKTDNKVIETLADKGNKLAKILLEYKKYDKDLGTYYERGGNGMLTLVQDGDIIHHSLNNVQTETGRLSSSKPNMQNLPRGNTSDVREMFISRFDGGLMAEIDYSQLEVVVQAFLTRDPQLIDHVNEGVDFHCVRLAAKLGEDYQDVVNKAKGKNGFEKDPWYDLQRTLAKGFSFQRAYGAGKKAIAASTGMSEDEVQLLIDAEDALYPRVNAYNRWVANEVKKNKCKTDLRSLEGAVRHYGWHTSPTGKRYGFTEYDAPDFLKRDGTLTSFKPTEMKNYSVQGAAGEIVLTVLGKLWRHFVANENYCGKALLVNTVHDCVWFDMDRDVAETVVSDATRIMTSVPEFYEEIFGIDMPVQFRVDAEVGPNMKDLH
jgi:DNA polymerase I-like protein with 3'-5' exonuclease and polymerase domains